MYGSDTNKTTIEHVHNPCRLRFYHVTFGVVDRIGVSNATAPSQLRWEVSVVQPV